MHRPRADDSGMHIHPGTAFDPYRPGGLRAIRAQADFAGRNGRPTGTSFADQLGPPNIFSEELSPRTDPLAPSGLGFRHADDGGALLRAESGTGPRSMGGGTGRRTHS